MPAQDPITPGRFVWHELNSQDLAASRAFYAGLFGWTFSARADGYEYIANAGATIGGLFKAPAPFIPTHWLPYVSVDDVDASQRVALDAKCQLIAGPMDVENGRFVIVKDAQGAFFQIWRGKGGDRPLSTAPSLGDFCWDQLNTPDPDAAFATYAAIFGWTRRAFAGRSDWSTLLNGEHMVASMTKAPPGVPAHWLSFVRVGSLAEACRNAQRLGGTVLVERIDVPEMGAYCVLRDTLGAGFAVFQSA